MNKPLDSTPNTIKTICAYCGVGCGIVAEVDTTTRQIKIKGDTTHPANYGRLCSKGSALAETIGLESRLLYPEIRGQRVNWDTAITTVAEGFQKVINAHGPDAVALYVSGQLVTEDYYVANKLMKGFIGSANIDTNSRLCMSSAVAAHKRAFGTDTVPNCYEDLELAELIVLVGSNTAWCHPVSFQRIRDWKERNPAVKVVVIDPRRTATCDIADLHLAIAPGTDVALFNGLLTFLAQSNALDQAYISQFTEGFAQTLAAAQRDAKDCSQVAQRCRLDENAVNTFFDWFAHTQKTLTLFSQGVNQSSSGVDKGNAIINCHLATGRIGKPGAGPFSITGQPNAMGGREVGGLANQLAAHMDYDTPGDIERLARFWQAPKMATAAGLKAVDLFDAVYDGRVKAIWIIATNPVVSLPNADKVKAALQGCDFVVVSDCAVKTDTLDLAHVKLPALGWSEKQGTVTNSERRISHQRPLLPPAGEAKADWWIISQVAKKMGFEQAFSYEHPVNIFREHAALSGFENSAGERPRAFDISAYSSIDAQAYQALLPTQWPINAQAPQGTARMFSDGVFFTANRKARFIPVSNRSPANLPNASYPLVLNTGRLRDQWHTMTRTALAARLNTHRPEPFVEIHPEDAKIHGITAGHIAQVESVWGALLARVIVTDSQQKNSVFIPMHWTQQFATKSRVGALVNPVVDPISGQPESKHTPVKISLFPATYFGFILSRKTLAIPGIDYLVSIHGDTCQRYELAGIGQTRPWFEWLEQLLRDNTAEHKTLLQLQWQHYEDTSRGIYRAAAFRDNQLDTLFCVAPKPGVENLPQRDYLSSLFSKTELNTDERLALLSGLPTVGTQDSGATICACFNVGEKTILNLIKENNLSNHHEVGKYCKAGTNCGSCIPEIKALLGKIPR